MSECAEPKDDGAVAEEAGLHLVVGSEFFLWHILMSCLHHGVETALHAETK